MKDRFEGTTGQRLRVEALQTQKLVQGDISLAKELSNCVELIELEAGQPLFEQGDSTNDLYFIITGVVSIVVNGRSVAHRGAGDHVGEMAAIQPTQVRSATVVAVEPSLVARITEPEFADIASRYPQLYRTIARELSRRLLERNKLVGGYRDKIRVFIISSVEALSVARTLQVAFEHDPFVCTVWTDGVFRATGYTIEALEAAVDSSDFAIAIAHADDITEARGQQWPVPRDNVIFELGLFMGRLGRARSILMEPREEKVKLPSDMAGLTTIPYRFEKGGDAAAMLAPAANRLREHINSLGPNNG